MSKKPVEPICKNCRLYDAVNGMCKVTIYWGSERLHLYTEPESPCHLDELGIPVEEVRFWVEDPQTHEKTDGKGIVKIQYPEGFFGKTETFSGSNND